MTKIFNHRDLVKKLDNLRKKNLKIVLCHGVFDILHSGHILHFKEAKALGDILVVSITKDEFINKGPNRPFLNTTQRMKIISELRLVDFVVDSPEISAIHNISMIKPDIYCKGPDYKNEKLDLTGKIIREKKILKSFKGKIMYTKSPKLSSSNLLNNNFNYLSYEQKKYIENIKKNNQFEFRSLFKKIEKMRVLIIGELIIDRYIFGEAVGKSSKDPIIVLNENKTLSYLGGSASIAKNLSSLSKKVTLLTLKNQNCEENKFINKEINNLFKVKYFTKKNFKTIVKKRFVESLNNRKLLGLYNINDEIIDKKNENKIINYLNNNSKNFDTVIVADYGHGLISEKISNSIKKSFKNCFINTQINSFNIRSQNINKYKNSNCVIINEGELRLDLKDNTNSLQNLSKVFFKKYKVKTLVVTSGSKGANIFYNSKNKKSISCPAFGSIVIDKTGSGDSLLALFSIFKTLNLNDEISLLIGSLAAAESLKNIANSKIIQKDSIIKSIENIFA